MSTRLIWLRRVLLAVAYVTAVVIAPLLIEVFNYYNKAAIPTQPMEAPAFAGALPAPPTPDPNKKIAVVLTDVYGAEITDTLPPFEILARSGIFCVYSVAPERVAIPLMPGPVRGPSALDFVPHLSFADYDAVIGAAPELIVVPNLPGYTPERDAAVLDWIRAHFGPRTTPLGICDGTTIVADTGLANGHLATSNPADFDYVEARAPSATWLRNLRYVDDGAVVTSSAVASGSDATLHVVDRFAGRATALDVAPTGIHTYRRARRSALRAAGQPEAGDGALHRVRGPPAARCAVVRRLFVPRFTFSTVPALDRVLMPAGESAYDATLQDLARTRHAAVAQTIASSLFYPADSALFVGAAWPVRDLAAAAALVLLGISLVFGAT